MTMPRERAQDFCVTYGLELPILQAPMATASPPALAAAVAGMGGMGACGALPMSPSGITRWMEDFRSLGGGPTQVNLWVPEPAVATPTDTAEEFLASFGEPGPELPAGPDFEEQFTAIVQARPTVMSTIMGLLDAAQVRRLREAGIAWFACATTLDEALAAQRAGADAVVAQGAEAGGHRGTFVQEQAVKVQIGLFALLPHLAEHLDVPVIAAGGVADGRAVAGALTLGASAVQVGTALLRAPETAIAPAWAAALPDLAPEETVLTRAFTGRLARSAPTRFAAAWLDPAAPPPAPYPAQRRLVARVRTASTEDLAPRWAGQRCAAATDRPAAEVVSAMWREASALLA